MNRPAIQRVAAVFRDYGTVEYMITYTHVDETLTPGSKKSATTAARMVRHALEVALEALDTWAVCGADPPKAGLRLRTEC